MKSKLTLLILLLLFASIAAQDFSPVDRQVTKAIADSVFPGAVVVVGNSDSILFEKAYGNFTYDKNSPEVTNETMFDMASVTKAFGTNFVVMKLVDEGKLDIMAPVSKYLPDFSAKGKDKILVRDLLIHESGLPAYYTPKPLMKREEIIDSIMNLSKAYETNKKMVYSCLNFVSLMLVNESIIKMPMWEFYKRNFTDPLNMTHTMFVPPENLKLACAPTQDQQGVVHDPLARGLGGLSGNAGLFSTGDDLAKLCMLMLNKGELNGKRYLSEETINKFTKRQSDISSRALGFDTRSDSGYSSSGRYFSHGSYGHTGYTGTSIWIDPVKDIFVVFLTNRVYPDDTASIGPVRPKIHNAVMKSLGLDN